MGDWNHVNGYLIRPELQYAVEAALTLNKPLLLWARAGAAAGTPRERPVWRRLLLKRSNDRCWCGT